MEKLSNHLLGARAESRAARLIAEQLCDALSDLIDGRLDYESRS